MYYPATEVLEHFIKESDNEKITKFFYNDDYLLMLKDETQQKIREDNYKKFKECYREKSLDIKKTIKLLGENIEKDNVDDCCMEDGIIIENDYSRNSKIYLEYQNKIKHLEELKSRGEYYINNDLSFSLELLEDEHNFILHNELLQPCRKNGMDIMSEKLEELIVSTNNSLQNIHQDNKILNEKLKTMGEKMKIIEKRQTTEKELIPPNLLSPLKSETNWNNIPPICPPPGMVYKKTPDWYPDSLV